MASRTGNRERVTGSGHKLTPVSEAATRPDPGALFWSINAMDRARMRIHSARFNQEAYAAIGEAVWWVTVVDKTLEKTAAYKRVIGNSQYIRDTLRGLRSVRNRIGHEVAITDFVNFKYFPMPDGGRGKFWVTTWKPIAPPIRNVAHALDNHHAYVAVLQGEDVYETFSVATRYLQGIADLIHPVAHQWPSSSTVEPQGMRKVWPPA